MNLFWASEWKILNKRKTKAEIGKVAKKLVGSQIFNFRGPATRISLWSFKIILFLSD